MLSGVWIIDGPGPSCPSLRWISKAPLPASPGGNLLCVSVTTCVLPAEAARQMKNGWNNYEQGRHHLPPSEWGHGKTERFLRPQHVLRPRWIQSNTRRLLKHTFSSVRTVDDDIINICLNRWHMMTVCTARTKITVLNLQYAKCNTNKLWWF